MKLSILYYCFNTSDYAIKNLCSNESRKREDKIAILSMEIVCRITPRLLYILAFPAFVTPGWYCRQKIRYRFVPLANLYPLITPSLVYNTHDCNLDWLCCPTIGKANRESLILLVITS